MTHPADRIAAVIRRFPNNTDPAVLGAAIAEHLDEDDRAGATEVITDIIRRVNPDQTMGAGALAEAIWDDLTGDVPPSLRVAFTLNMTDASADRMVVKEFTRDEWEAMGEEQRMRLVYDWAAKYIDVSYREIS